MTAEPGLRRAQVAGAAGVNVQTLRYYERRGLLREPVRSLGGHRLYPAETVLRLRAIKAAQRLGFTLAEVAGLLDPRNRARTGGLRNSARVKLAEVEDRLAELAAVRETLLAAVAAGCNDLVECAQAEQCPMPFGLPGHLA